MRHRGDAIIWPVAALPQHVGDMLAGIDSVIVAKEYFAVHAPEFPSSVKYFACRAIVSVYKPKLHTCDFGKVLLLNWRKPLKFSGNIYNDPVRFGGLLFQAIQSLGNTVEA